MIIAKIESTNEHCNVEMTIRGGFRTIMTEYAMIGVKIADAFAEKDPGMAKVFEAMMRQACEDCLLTDPVNAVKDVAKIEDAEKDDLTLKDALDKLNDILEELKK